MFGSLLEWAGEIRTTDAEATGTGIVYARPEYIEGAVRSLFDRLEREDFLTGPAVSRRGRSSMERLVTSRFAGCRCRKETDPDP